MAYVHSVAADRRRIGDADGHRIALVFRRGLEVEQTNDTGTPCTDLTPRPDHTYTFGRNFEDLAEGRIYSRQALFDMGALRCVASTI